MALETSQLTVESTGADILEAFRQKQAAIYRELGHAFFRDRDDDCFYLVNFNEERYFRIDKDSPYYELCMHLYCPNWVMAERVMKVKSTYLQVSELSQIDGSD